MKRLSDNIKLILLAVFIALCFSIDVFLFFSKLNIPILNHFKEILIIAAGLSWYSILAPKIKKGVQQIRQKLYLLIVFIALNYLAAIFINLFINPVYDTSSPRLL